MTPSLYADQVKFNRERIASLHNQRSADCSELDRKIDNTRLSAAIDSAENAHNLELTKNRFASEEVLESSRLKWKKELLAYRSLLASRVAVERKCTIEVRRLELQNAQLTAKARSAAMHAEILSSADGMITDIREVPHNNKTEITIIVNALPLPELPAIPAGVSPFLP